MKTIRYVLFISALLWRLSCRSKLEDEPKEPEIPVVVTPPEEPEDYWGGDVSLPEEIIDLVGTVWELIGIVDMATGEITEPYCPEKTKWSETCYTFSFYRDKPGTGLIDLRWLSFYLDLSKKNILGPMSAIEVEYCPESNYRLFEKAVHRIHSYAYKNNELKFFCDREYLLFKPYEGKEISILPVPDEILGLAGKGFKLLGLMDAETDGMVMPAPFGCATPYCHSINFWEGGKAKLKLSCTEFSLHFDRNPVVLWKNNISECSEDELFNKMAATIDSCTYENDQLKLICNNKKNYLFFKLLEQ